MDKTYTAVYYDPSGRFYKATIFVSSITLSIRYTDENSVSRDVYWLAEKIISFEPEAVAWVLTFKGKDGQLERLVLRDTELVKAVKKKYSHHRFAGGWKHHILGNTRNKLLLLLSVIIAVILTGYFWFIPWLGERAAGRISKEREISMGESMYGSMISRYKIDSAKTNLINDFYQELHYSINYPINITVVKSEEVNAFAIPGGHIVVYTSILDRMKRPEELAALLSHEGSHIALRHSLRNVFRSMARKMFLMLIIGNEAGLAGFLVDNADNLKGLEYSRALETEADNHGIRLMQSSSIDATGMLHLMEILQQETKGKELSALLSTHPVFVSRIANIKSQVNKTGMPALKQERLESLFKKIQHADETNNW
jgi:predicted Zn-dependent protease